MSFRMLPLGSEAPDFTLSDQNGQPVSLYSFRNRQAVVLVFYPADYTQVCTAQLCEFRDEEGSLQEKGIAVLGINPARPKTHQAFAAKHGFSFPLLHDAGGQVASRYGAILIPRLLVNRTVYGIDRQGRVCFAQRGKPSISNILLVMDS